MPRHLNRRRIAPVAVAALAVVLSACTSSTGSSGGSFEPQRATIGGLEVTATPTRLDASGANFTVVFDTHTGAPTIDVAANATLVVGDTAWLNPTWDGDGPGGHHRRGALRFTSAGAVRGTARLAITGLDQPLQLTWPLNP